MSGKITIELDIEPIKEEYSEDYLVVHNGWGVYDYCALGDTDFIRLLGDYMFVSDYILHGDIIEKLLTNVPEGTKQILVEMDVTVYPVTNYYLEGTEYDLEFDWVDERISYV